MQGGREQDTMVHAACLGTMTCASGGFARQVVRSGSYTLASASCMPRGSCGRLVGLRAARWAACTM